MTNQQLTTIRPTSLSPAKVEKVTGGRQLSGGFQMPLPNSENLIHSVRRGYVRATMDNGIEKPTVHQVLAANRLQITDALGNCHGLAHSHHPDAKALIHLTNADQSKLKPFIEELFADAKLAASFANPSLPKGYNPRKVEWLGDDVKLDGGPDKSVAPPKK